MNNQAMSSRGSGVCASLAQVKSITHPLALTPLSGTTSLKRYGVFTVLGGVKISKSGYQLKNCWVSPNRTHIAFYGEDIDPLGDLDGAETFLYQIKDSAGRRTTNFKRIASLDPDTFRGFGPQESIVTADGTLCSISNGFPALNCPRLNVPDGWEILTLLPQHSNDATNPSYIIRSGTSYRLVTPEGHSPIFTVKKGVYGGGAYSLLSHVSEHGDTIVLFEHPSTLNILMKDGESWSHKNIDLAISSDPFLLTCSKDGRNCFIGCKSGEILRVDLTTSEQTLIGSVSPPDGYRAFVSIAANSDGSVLLLGTGDGKILAFNTNQKKLIGELPLGGRSGSWSFQGPDDDRTENVETLEVRAAMHMQIIGDSLDAIATTNFGELIGFEISPVAILTIPSRGANASLA